MTSSRHAAAADDNVLPLILGITIPTTIFFIMLVLILIVVIVIILIVSLILIRKAKTDALKETIELSPDFDRETSGVSSKWRNTAKNPKLESVRLCDVMLFCFVFPSLLSSFSTTEFFLVIFLLLMDLYLSHTRKPHMIDGTGGDDSTPNITESSATHFRP